MASERPESGGGDEQRLSSWKAIARYLGRDVRTVERWERERGMPVHRVPRNGGRGPVFAYPSELDAWLRGEGSPAPSRPPLASPAPARVLGHRPLSVGLAAVALIAVGAVAAALWPSGAGRGGGPGPAGTPPAVLTTFAVSGPVLKGLDADGRQELVLTEPEGREFSPKAAVVRVATPDGDVRWIVGANARVEPEGRVVEGEMFAVDPGDVIGWRRRVTSSQTFGAQTFGPPWVSQSVAAEAPGPAARILWAVRHQTWWPSILHVLGPDGRSLGRFVNAGWIERVAFADVGGAELALAGGISNSRSSAMLAVFDADSVRGSSPEDDGSPFACADCAAGGPTRYLVFPPTEVSRASGVPYNRTLDVVPTPEGIQVWTQEGPVGSNVAWVYLVAPDFGSARAAPSDTYWARHEALHASGELDHPASECPERSSPPVVRMWQRDTGWQVLPTVVAASGG